MRKLLTILLLITFVGACQAKRDELYYLAHPLELQQALENCPDKSSTSMNCKEIKHAAITFNRLADEFRSSPQQFGLKILDLQQKIAQQKALVESSKNNNNLQKQLNLNRQDLEKRLRIVKVFESPKG